MVDGEGGVREGLDRANDALEHAARLMLGDDRIKAQLARWSRGSGSKSGRKSR